MLKEKKVFVIGHKNPDTDSICSAIAYAALKNKTDDGVFVPKRAGEVNNETKYVLDFFDVETPEFIGHVGTQVKDVEIKPTPSLNEGISLKNAWNKMRALRESTMPIVNDGVLEGIISVKDIATANMDIYETRILAISHTIYTIVLDAIDGTMIVGDSEEEITKGKILIGAANPDLLENYVEDGDMLLTGNRFENQLCGIEMNAGCIVVCTGAPISKTIQKLAKENNCKIISTPHDLPNFERLLGDGSQYGVTFSYKVQPSPDGLAQAFLLGEEFIDGEPCALVLGDNIFYGNGLGATLRGAVRKVENGEGATVFGYYVDDPERYGVVEFDENRKAISIVEKPEHPASNYAVTGLYFYDERVTEFAKQITPSPRGELEITDLNRMYLDEGRLHVRTLGRGYAWLDTGTMDSLFEAGEFVRTVQRAQGLPIAIVEEIAYENGWITREQLLESARRYGKSPYGQHLRGIADGQIMLVPNQEH